MQTMDGQVLSAPTKKEVCRVMIFTELAYFSDGSTSVIRSFNKPLSATAPTKREIKKKSYIPSEIGEVEL